MIKMIILTIAVSFLPMFLCDRNTGLFWLEKEINGLSTAFKVLYGDPQTYFQNFADGTNNSENYFFNSFTLRSSVLQSVAFGAESEFVAISDVQNGKLIIYELSDILTKSSFAAKYEFTNFVNITGIAFAGYFNLLYFVGGYPSPYIGALDLTNSRWIKLYNQTIIGDPYSIAIDQKNRFIFWSDLGLIPKIRRSNLYGEEGIVIVNSLRSKPVNLMVDKLKERLFWLDGDLKSSDFDGNNIINYKISVVGMYSTFVIYKDLAIFGTFNDSRLDSYKISQDATGKFASFHTPDSTAMIISASLDSKEFLTFISNPCVGNPCVHMCFPKKAMDYFCTCPSGYILNSDGRTCTKKSDGNSLKGIGFKFLGLSFLALKMVNLFK